METLKEYVINLRREFHMHPELSGQEEWTSQRICQELNKLGISYNLVGDKSIVGTISNGSGHRLALRADFDALPIDERTDVPWKSAYPGIMHACGHDAHTAWLLGTARLLVEHREQWNGTVYLCFQQGEEIGIGAADCIDFLKTAGGVDSVLGAHIMPLLPSGDIDLVPGVRAAGFIPFSIHIHGKSGHGARPDLSVSAAEIACDIYQHIIRIPSNHHEAARTTVISPCMIRVGDTHNVIPDKGLIEGTIRFLAPDDKDILMGKLRTTAEQIAALHGGTAEVTFSPNAAYPIVNDVQVTTVGQHAASACGFSLVNIPPTSASDNFANYLHEYPGFFAFVGAKSSRAGTSPINHNDHFDLDEAVLSRVSEFLFTCVTQMKK